MTLFLGSLGCGRDAASYLKKGNEFLEKNNCEEALINFNNAVDRDPRLSAAYYGTGICQYRLGRLDGSLEALTRAAELKPDDEKVSSELANVTGAIYVLRGRSQALRASLVKVTNALLAKNPDSPDGLRLHGMLQMEDRDLEGALTSIRKADSLRPGDPPILLLLAEAYERNENPVEAERVGKELERLHPDDLGVYDWLFQFYTNHKRPADAEKVLLERVANLPYDANAILALASYYQRINRPEKADQTIATLVNKADQFSNAYLLAGDYYKLFGKAEQALDYYKKGAAKKPQDFSYPLRMAQVYQAIQQHGDAVKSVNEAIRLAPEEHEAVALRASIFIEGGKPEEMNLAMADCRALVKAQPQVAEYRFLLGRSYLSTGDSQNAKAQMSEAVALDPQFIEPRIGLAQIYREQGDYSAALRSAGEAMQLDPKNPRARLLHAGSLVASGDVRGGRRELTALIAQYPGSPDLELEFGLLDLAEKQPKAAEKIFSALIASKPRFSRALAGLVLTYTSQQETDRAVQLLTNVVAADGEYLDARRYLAQTELFDKKFDVALEQYKILAARAPESVDYKIGLAASFEGKGDRGNAIREYEAAAKLAPKNAIVAGRLAILRQASGRENEAAALDHNKALELAPSDPALQNNRAFFLAETGGDLDEAIRLIQSALQKLPGNPALLDTLAWIYVKKGMNDTAISVLAPLVKTHPADALMHYHFGTALFQKGDNIGAKRELDAALAARPSNEDAVKIRTLLNAISQAAQPGAKLVS